MSKDKPDRPQPIIVPAPATAAAQSEFNEEAARKQRALNMVWQTGPEGTLSYMPTGTQTEGIPDFSAVTQLHPANQALLDTERGIKQKFGDISTSQLGAVEGQLSDPYSTLQFGEALSAPDISSLGAAPGISPDVREQHRQAIISRAQPQLDRDRAALETQLSNRGFVTGSEAYNTAMDERNRTLSDFYLGADAQAGDEMARMYGLQNAARARDISEMTQDYQFAANARDRAIAEALRDRTQPMSELASLMNLSQPKAPAFIPTPQGTISAPDYLGAAYASANQQNTANQQAYNQQMAARNAQMEGLYGLVGTAGKVAGATYGGPSWTWGA